MNPMDMDCTDAVWDIPPSDPRVLPVILAGLGSASGNYEGSLKGLQDSLSEPEAFTAYSLMRAWAEQELRRPLEDVVAELVSFIDPQKAAARRRPAKVRSPEWVAAIIARIGGAGSEPTTLDQAGEVVGVTRERVRQVMVKVVNGLKPFQPLWIPQLDQAVEVVAERPRTEAELAQALADAGVTRNPFTAAALVSVARLLGHSLPGLPPASRAKNPIIAGVPEDVAAAVRLLVHKIRTNPGVATPSQVACEVSVDLGPTIDCAAVTAVVDTDPALIWCDAARTAFCARTVDTHRVKLANVARTMLSAAVGPITVDDIVRGYDRKAGLRGGKNRPVYSAAAQSYFAHDPEFLLTGDVVISAHPLDQASCLGRSVLPMVEILREADGNVLDRTTLLQEAVARGVNPTTASMWLTFHEGMTNYGWAVWGLVGATPSLARVEALQAEVRNGFEEMQAEDSWMPNGHKVITFVATRAFLRSHVLAAPASLGVPEATFDLRDPAGRRLGHVHFSDDHTFVWGWGPAIDGLGITHGGKVQLELDLVTGQGIISTF